MKKHYPILRVLAMLAAGVWLGGCQSPSADTPTELTTLADGQYIVVLKTDPLAGARLAANTPGERQAAVQTFAEQLLAKAGAEPTAIEHVYDTALKGFSARLTNAQVGRLRQDSRVAYVSANRITDASEPAQSVVGAARLASGTQATPWGVTAVGGPVDYAGSNVVWVLDSGIDLTHPDLNVDSTRGFTVFRSGPHRSTRDFDGHGSIVAGIIGARNNTFGVVGIAAGATLIPVKVCAAPTSVSSANLVAGINFVANNAQPGDVVNISLGIAGDNPVDQAIQNLLTKGVYVAVSAGNYSLSRGSTHATQISPARGNGPNLYTMAGYDQKGLFAAISVSGIPPIDYATPCTNIRTTYKGGAYFTLSQGTTAATAHMSGILLANSGVVYAQGSVTDRDGGVIPKASRVP